LGKPISQRLDPVIPLLPSDDGVETPRRFAASQYRHATVGRIVASPRVPKHTVLGPRMFRRSDGE